MSELYRMIDELHEAVEPLRQDVLFRRYPFLRMGAGMNKMADAFREFAISIENSVDSLTSASEELRLFQRTPNG